MSRATAVSIPASRDSRTSPMRSGCPTKTRCTPISTTKSISEGPTFTDHPRTPPTQTTISGSPSWPRRLWPTQKTPISNVERFSATNGAAPSPVRSHTPPTRISARFPSSSPSITSPTISIFLRAKSKRSGFPAKISIWTVTNSGARSAFLKSAFSMRPRCCSRRPVTATPCSTRTSPAVSADS